MEVFASAAGASWLVGLDNAKESTTRNRESESELKKKVMKASIGTAPSEAIMG
jgi:hypothetical protein